MKYYKEQNGEETSIVLFVLIPDCVHCRKRIEEHIMEYGCFERVVFGYPMREGSAVTLVYNEGKHPDVDFWYKAQCIKEDLDSFGYRVL